MEQTNNVVEKPVFITEEEINKMIFVMYNNDLPELRTKIDIALTKLDELIKLAKDGTI